MSYKNRNYAIATSLKDELYSDMTPLELSVASDNTSDKQEELDFAGGCVGSAGTFGTFGTASGCVGTAGSLGTYGCASPN